MIKIEDHDHFIAYMLARQFDLLTDTPYTEDNYIQFVHVFAAANNVSVVGGETIYGDWTTVALEFETMEDRLLFKLKYGV